MIVRKMRPEEFDVTVNLFGYYRDEAIGSMPEIEQEYDENSVINTIKQYASQWNYCWFNAYEGQRPVGFVAGILSTCPWNEEKIVANIAFLYLLDSHKNMDNFRELMKTFEEWAIQCKAKQITAGDIGINIEKNKKLYEHFGFKSVLLTVKELDKWDS
jgi:GNAT superfamily N-acetyltransferase